MPGAATVVIGGGLSGLAAALRRTRAGVETVLLEGDARPGGVVRTEKHEGFLVEKGPNTVRPTPAVMGLARELGLEAEILLSDPKLPRYVDFRGALHALPSSPGALVSTRLLSAAGKWRIFGEPFRRGGGSPDESVRDFFSRRLGPEIADRIVTPFVGGIFAGDPARLAVADAFPSLARWEREHGSIFRGAIREARRTRAASPPPPGPKVRGLLSFREGLQALPVAMAGSLGPAFRPSTGAVALSRRPGGWRVSTASGDWDAAEVILAAPAAAAAELVRPFAPDAAAALDAIPHPPLAVLHLAWPKAALARPFRGFGHLVVPDPSRRVLGAVWSSSLFPGRAPEGQILVTVFLGGARDPDALGLSDADLVAAAARDLEAEGIVRGRPRLVLLTRWARAIPQYERGHGARIAILAQAESRLPGLHFLGNYRGGISVGDVLASALAV
jgi:oxygen-dependent protoporphyrinogen oxidase